MNCVLSVKCGLNMKSAKSMNNMKSVIYKEVV